MYSRLRKNRALAILIFAGIIFPLFQSAIFAASVKVVMEDATLADSTKESPILYIKNTGTDTLSNFYFYYYVTAERGNTLNYGTYYIPNTTVSMEKLDSVDYRLKFLVSSVSLKPNDSLQEQFALYYNYVNKVDKSNDYSYVASAVLTEDAKIPVYLTVNDSLIYGLDPNTPQKPSPKISAAPTTGKDSLKVQFTDSSTGTETSRLCTFGDGTTDTSKNPLHDYVKTGSFSVKLIVIGPGGKDSVSSPNLIVITATIPKPSSKISAAPTTGKDSLIVQFIDSSTGTITSRLSDLRRRNNRYEQKSAPRLCINRQFFSKTRRDWAGRKRLGDFAEPYYHYRHSSKALTKNIRFTYHGKRFA